MNNIHIQKAKLQDFPAYYDLRCENNNIYWTGYTKKPDYEGLLKWYKKHYSEKVYLIFLKKDIVGYIYAEYEKNCIELSIGISQEYEGKGIGGKAISHMLKLLESEEHEICAYIFESNIGSQKLFKKNNFMETDIYVEKVIGGRKERQIKFIHFE